MNVGTDADRSSTAGHEEWTPELRPQPGTSPFIAFYAAGPLAAVRLVRVGSSSMSSYAGPPQDCDASAWACLHDN